MTDLILQLQPFSQWLLRSTLQVSLLVCLILAVKAILGKRLSARWHYWLWLLLVVRMVLPVAPASNFSIFNFLPAADNQPMQLAAAPNQSQLPVESAVSDISSAETAGAAQAEIFAEPITAVPIEIPVATEKFQLTGVQILSFVYLTGVVALAVYLLAGCFSFWRTIKMNRPVTNQKVLDILEDCKARMGVRTIVAVVETSRVKSPVLFGFVRPRLLLPIGLIDKLRPEELSHIFCHELAHIKRCDIAANWLIAALQTLHWFNPLVWYAFYRMRADRELACDSLVLSVIDTDQQGRYGRTIIRLVEMFSQTQLLPAMAGILETKSNLKKRITMIAKFKKGSYKFSVLAIILLTAIGCVALTDEKPEAEPTIGDTEPTVYEKEPAAKSDFIATLPNGVKVELLGVSNYPNNSICWRPDGSKSEEMLFVKVEENERQDNFGFVAKINGAEKPSISYGSILGAGGHSSHDRVIDANKNKVDGYKALKAAITGGMDSTSITFGISVEPWQTLATYSGKGEGTSISGKEMIIFSRAFETKDSVGITISTKQNKERAERIVAIGENGQIHTAKNSSAYNSNDIYQLTNLFYGLKLENIAEFQFQTRPYQWVEFKNVSLKPGQKTDVEIEVKTAADVIVMAENLFDIGDGIFYSEQFAVMLAQTEMNMDHMALSYEKEDWSGVDHAAERVRDVFRDIVDAIETNPSDATKIINRMLIGIGADVKPSEVTMAGDWKLRQAIVNCSAANNEYPQLAALIYDIAEISDELHDAIRDEEMSVVPGYYNRLIQQWGHLKKLKSIDELLHNAKPDFSKVAKTVVIATPKQKVKTAKFLKIVVYGGGNPEPEIAIKLPLAGLKFVNSLIPKRTREQIAAQGIDLDGIMQTIEGDLQGATEPMTLVNIQDGNERIIISLEDMPLKEQ